MKSQVVELQVENKNSKVNEYNYNKSKSLSRINKESGKRKWYEPNMSDLWYNNENANTKTNFRNSGRTERVKREMQRN